MTDYSTRVRQVLERIAGWLNQIPKPHVETVLAEDSARNVFLLARLGWDEGKRIDNTVTLVRVRDGKVWVEEDNTDLTVAEEIMRAGVPREDIVLGFQPPEMRHLTEFAVA